MVTPHEIGEWLKTNWSLDLTLREWWARLSDARLAAPMWPVDAFGQGLDSDQLGQCSRAFADAGAIGAPTGLGMLMGGPIVVQFGTAEQKQRLLPPLLNGTEGWCQLFSEPGAGSDLASVSTSAIRDGDEWVVNGQKVWTSGAHHCARGMLVARTNLDVPKHRGLSYFIIDMQQPGIEIRPIKQMNSESHFSEVFFTDARVHDSNRISDINNGWAVTVATLAFERSGLSSPEGVDGVRPAAGELAGLLDVKVGELIDRFGDRPTSTNEEAAEYANLWALAREHERTGDATIRQLLATVYTRERISDFMSARAAAAVAAGKPLGPEASIAKLWWTESLQRSRDAGSAILGPHLFTPSPFQKFLLSLPSARIAGGSDEVQRNIIGERVLGLPKDIVVDRDIPFRELRRS